MTCSIGLPAESLSEGGGKGNGGFGINAGALSELLDELDEDDELDEELESVLEAVSLDDADVDEDEGDEVDTAGLAALSGTDADSAVARIDPSPFTSFRFFTSPSSRDALRFRTPNSCFELPARSLTL